VAGAVQGTPDIDTAILRATFELFVERGIDGASIEQIAKRAGVGKLTVYRRWSSKEEVLAQAIESLILLAHPQLMRHSQLLPQSMTTMENSPTRHRDPAARRKVSSTYRNDCRARRRRLSHVDSCDECVRCGSALLPRCAAVSGRAQVAGWRLAVGAGGEGQRGGGGVPVG
jgi:AcrR family transcriptional regulator